MKRRVSLSLLLSLAAVAPGVVAASGEGLVWSSIRADDPALVMAAMPDITGDGVAELIAGLDSGRVVCFGGASPGAELWSVTLDGCVLALLPVADTNNDGARDVLASTSTGLVACMTGEGEAAGTLLWTFQSTCGVAVLTSLPDQDGDGVAEVLAGGAEQRIFLRNGKTGAEIWTRDLAAYRGFGYIHRLLEAGNLGGDATADLVMLDWDGDIAAFNGANGNTIWTRSATGGFTEAMDRMPDVTSDGLADFVCGGNNAVVRLVSGANGADVWTCNLERPTRAVLATSDVSGDGVPDCFAATAGGVVASFSGAGSGAVLPRWSVNIGDVVRVLVSPGDLNGDTFPDVVAGAENGVVAAYSGADGTELGRWQGVDVVRTIVALPGGDGPFDIAVACLDGTIAVLSSEYSSWVDAGAKSAAREFVKREPASPRLYKLQTNATRVPILLYHDVIPYIRYPYGVSLANFTAQMDLLVDGGYTTVTLDEVADWVEGTIELPEKSVCITFDGPYEGHYTHAYGILRERGLISNSYITTDWIGTVNHADWHQLRRMEASGIEDIQNHSANHPSLTSLPAGAVANQLTWSNAAIAAHLGGKVATHHAYPSGAYSNSVIDILSGLGFRTATTVVSRAAVRTDRLLALPRLGILPGTTLATFKGWIGYVEPPEAMLPYRFAGTVGTGWNFPSFGDVDAQGRLWVADYSAENVRVFESNGSEASFSPITQGLGANGATESIRAASGVAVTPTGEVLVTIADFTHTPNYFALFRYDAATGAMLTGRTFDYRPGDVDCDAEGRYYVVEKVRDYWHVYAPDGTELAGSPLGSGRSSSFVQRGISVLPDASRVYTISETDGAVHYWRGSIDGTGLHYVQEYDLVTGLDSTSGGVDVMDNGTILVSAASQGRILGYDAAHKFLGVITGGTPPLSRPRGTAFTPDGRVLWVISYSGFVQRWEREGTFEGFTIH